MPLLSVWTLEGYGKRVWDACRCREAKEGGHGIYVSEGEKEGVVQVSNERPGVGQTYLSNLLLY